MTELTLVRLLHQRTLQVKSRGARRREGDPVDAVKHAVPCATFQECLLALGERFYAQAQPVTAQNEYHMQLTGWLNQADMHCFAWWFTTCLLLSKTLLHLSSRNERRLGLIRLHSAKQQTDRAGQPVAQIRPGGTAHANSLHTPVSGSKHGNDVKEGCKGVTRLSDH